MEKKQTAKPPARKRKKLSLFNSKIYAQHNEF